MYELIDWLNYLSFEWLIDWLLTQVKEVLGRLLKEEDLLRRDQQNLAARMGDKELMIMLQQRKIAALDEANHRLVRSMDG